MSTPERDQLIKTYIGRILARQTQKKDTLQGDELRAIAREVGLSEEEIAAVEQEAKDHFERGQGFVRHHRLDDAITELKEALALAPVSVEYTHALALAYQRRYQEKRGRVDQEEARRLAKQTLEIDPKHEPSFALLNELDRKPSPRQSSSILSALLMGALIFPVIGGLGYLLSGGGEPPAPYAPPSKLLQTPTGKAPSYKPISPLPSKDDDDVEPPITFNAGEKAPGLVFHNRGTIINNYPDSSFLKVLGDFENQGSTELSKVKVQIQMLDDGGEVVDVMVVDAISDYQAVLRPRDTKGFHTIKKVSRDIKSLNISVQTATSQPAPSVYGEPAPVEVNWAFTRPAHIKLRVGERASQFSQYTTSAYHEATFEFTNEGEGALTSLKIQLSYFDQDDNLLSTDETFVISPSEPSILPEQTRPHKTIESVSSKFHHYKLTIIEAR